MSRSLQTILLVAFCHALVALFPVSAVGEDSPEAVLTKHGLKYSSGYWQIASDLRTADRIRAMERLERRVQELRDQIEKVLEFNERLKIALVRLNDAQQNARAARKAVKDGSPEQKRLDEQVKQQEKLIEQHKKSIVPLDKLGATPPLKGLIMELVAARSEMAFHLLSARRQIRDAPSRYEHLKKDSDVTSALAALEPPGQLPPPRNYTSESRSLDRFEKIIFNDELPMFREGKQWRVTGIANEELPIAFSFDESKEPTAITRSMAASLGLNLDDKATVRRRVAETDVDATPVRLASLRFGRHVIDDVEVLVLSPENENLGARLGLDVFRDFTVSVVPERLVLRLEAK
jgi:hypothetical protein